MKITIEFSQVKTTTTGKEYKSVSAKDENGQDFQASVWSDSTLYAQVAPGATIECEVKTSADGKYKNLVEAGSAFKGTGFAAKKSADIVAAQERKEKSIFAAQDRSSWMWAKTNAATLLANTHRTQEWKSIEEITNEVIDLATNIYNAEPNKPF